MNSKAIFVLLLVAILNLSTRVSGALVNQQKVFYQTLTTGYNFTSLTNFDGSYLTYLYPDYNQFYFNFFTDSVPNCQWLSSDVKSQGCSYPIVLGDPFNMTMTPTPQGVRFAYQAPKVARYNSSRIVYTITCDAIADRVNNVECNYNFTDSTYYCEFNHTSACLTWLSPNGNYNSTSGFTFTTTTSGNPTTSSSSTTSTTSTTSPISTSSTTYQTTTTSTTGYPTTAGTTTTTSPTTGYYNCSNFNYCSGHGACISDSCYCDQYYTGPECQYYNPPTSTPTFTPIPNNGSSEDFDCSMSKNGMVVSSNQIVNCSSSGITICKLDDGSIVSIPSGGSINIITRGILDCKSDHIQCKSGYSSCSIDYPVFSIDGKQIDTIQDHPLSESSASLSSVPSTITITLLIISLIQLLF